MPDTAVRIAVPRELALFAAERRISFFIGAGFSKNINASIPIISDAYRVAAPIANIDQRLLHMHTNGDFLSLCEYLAIKGQLETFINHYYSLLHPSTYEVKGSRAHLLLAEIDCESVFTTNWDFWIERAFEAISRPHVIIRDVSDIVEQKVYCQLHGPDRGSVARRRTTVSKHTTPRIIKLHGDFSRKELIVASLRSFFDRIVKDSPLDVILAADLLSKSFVFIGYGFSDPNIRIIWHKFLAYRQTLAEAGRSITLPPSFLLSMGLEWLRYLGITPIYADPAPAKMQASVESLFEGIREAQASR